MDCSNALSLIDAYNQGKLVGKQKEQFLLHVKDCPSCYEELDIQYIVLAGIKGLEADESMDFDFSTQLHDKVTDELEAIRKKKLKKLIITPVILVIVIILLTVLLWECHMLFRDDFKGVVDFFRSL